MSAAGQPLGPQPVVVGSAAANPGVGMPDWAAPATTRRQASCALAIASVKYGRQQQRGGSDAGRVVVGLGDPVQEPPG